MLCCIPDVLPLPQVSPLTLTSAARGWSGNSSAVTTTGPIPLAKSLDLAGPNRPSVISRS